MTDSQLKALALRYTAAWSSGDPCRVAACFAEDGSLRINDGPPATGRAAIAATAQDFMTALPDLSLALDGVDAHAGGATYRWSLTGTNTGPGGKGSVVRISGYEEWTLGPDGLIAASQGHMDSDEYQRQLGADNGEP
jgi:hypothetical protein